MFGQKDDTQRQKKPAEARRDIPYDRLFAITRRLAQRISELEANSGSLRRDLNRIERKIYRDSNETPRKPNPENIVTPDRAGDGDFGIPWPAGFGL